MFFNYKFFNLIILAFFAIFKYFLGFFIIFCLIVFNLSFDLYLINLIIIKTINSTTNIPLIKPETTYKYLTINPYPTFDNNRLNSTIIIDPKSDFLFFKRIVCIL